MFEQMLMRKFRCFLVHVLNFVRLSQSDRFFPFFLLFFIFLFCLLSTNCVTVFVNSLEICFLFGQHFWHTFSKIISLSYWYWLCTWEAIIVLGNAHITFPVNLSLFSCSKRQLRLFLAGSRWIRLR